MKKVFTIIGILVGIALVIVGILCLSGEMGGNASTASSAGYSYDSGYTKFGADFYTYVNNNAQEAAEAGRTAARNLWEIAKLLKAPVVLVIDAKSMGASAAAIAAIIEHRRIP